MSLRWTVTAVMAVLFALAQILPGHGLPLGQAVVSIVTGGGQTGETIGIALAARPNKDEKDKHDNRNENDRDNGDDDDDDDDNNNNNNNQDDRDEDAENVDAYENADNAPGEGQNGSQSEETSTPTPGASSAPPTATSTPPTTAGAGSEPVPTPTLISPAAAAAPVATSTRQRGAPTATADTAQPTPTTATEAGAATPTPTATEPPTPPPVPAGPTATEPQVSGVANGSDTTIALGGDRIVVQVFPSMPTGTTIIVKRATKDQFPAVTGSLVSDLIFVVEGRDPSGGILLELPAQVNLIVHYQDADTGALVESQFTLSHLSLANFTWQPAANQVKDAGANYVSAPISELGAYAVHVP